MLEQIRFVSAFFSSRFFLPVLIIIITVITYINILPNQLFYDDEELIYRNNYVQNLTYLPKYFSENMIAGAGKSSNMYRPVLLISFAIDYSIWKNNPVGYHLTSIFLHVINSLLVFFLILKLFDNKLLSFFTSVFFAVHPVQSEAVAYASGRTDLLFSFFGLSSILLFLSYLIPKKAPSSFYLFSLLSFILSLLSKETAVILPFILILILTLFAAKLNIDKLRASFIIFPYFFITAVYVSLRLTLLNFANTLNFYSAPSAYSQNLFIRLFTFTKVFFEYIKIILFPNDLIYARSTPIVTSFFNPWVLFFILIISAICILAFLNRRKNPLYLFAVCWFFVTILPVSGIIPINSIISEHYLYLPSVSIFLSVSYFFYYLLSKRKNTTVRLTLAIFLAIILSLLSYRTILRNFDWKDPVTFYTKSLYFSPDNIPMRHNLAMTYAEVGQLDLAIREYKNVIAIADVYPNTHHNLANAYKEKGLYQEAEKEYLLTLQMDPNFLFSYAGLIDLYKITGEKEKLEEILKKINKIKKP